METILEKIKDWASENSGCGGDVPLNRLCDYIDSVGGLEKEKLPPDEIPKNTFIQDFLKESKFRDVDQQIGKILHNLGHVSNSLDNIVDFVDSRKMPEILSKISEITERIDNLERFEERIREAL